jgi:hypothetical protein
MAAVVEGRDATAGTFGRLQHLQHKVRVSVCREKRAERIGAAPPLHCLTVRGERVREELANEQEYSDVERLLQRGLLGDTRN